LSVQDSPERAAVHGNGRHELPGAASSPAKEGYTFWLGYQAHAPARLTVPGKVAKHEGGRSPTKLHTNPVAISHDAVEVTQMKSLANPEHYEGRPRPGTEQHDQYENLAHIFTPREKSGGPCLHIRLLKERLEMEVAMRREGLRLLVFSMFLICICKSLTITAKTEQRNDAQFLITNTLGLDGIDGIINSADLYSFMVQVSQNARIFFPLSSDYTEDPLAVVILPEATSFPSGPLLVPPANQMELRLQWSMTAWVAMDALAGTESRQENARHSIIRKSLPADMSGLSCWAWSVEGSSRFVLEYGRHNIDEGYVEITLDFSAAAGGSTAGWQDTISLCGINLNGTHAVAYLQSGPQVLESVAPLEHGFPTDCPGNRLEVGSEGLTLADVKYHPRMLSKSQFAEVLEGGQALVDLAMGVAPNGAAENIPQDSLDTALHVTEALGGVQELLGKVVGDTTSGGNEQLSVIASSLLGVDEAPPPAGPADGSGVLFSAAVDLTPLPVVVAGVVQPIDLTSAFQGLASSPAPQNFTLMWWANGNASLEGFQELVFTTPEGQPRFQVQLAQSSGFEGIPAWTFQFYSSPFCFGRTAAGLGAEYRAKCKKAPSWWCQAPSDATFGGTYDGIWRHFALSYAFIDSPGGGGGQGEGAVDFFLDGSPLCSVVISGSYDSIGPLGSPDSPSTVAFGVFDGGDGHSIPGSVQLLVKDMRLYQEHLPMADIKQLGLDPETAECLDLENSSDNPDFRTEFGLDCFRIGDAVRGEDPVAPSACNSGAHVRQNCPVSCLEDGRQRACWDTLPPLMNGELPVPAPPASANYTQPRRFMVELYPPDSAAAAQDLMGALRWRDDSDGGWLNIGLSVNVISANTLLASQNNTASADGGIFLIQPKALAGDETWWRNTDCLVQATNIGGLKKSAILLDVCMAEKNAREWVYEFQASAPPINATLSSGIPGDKPWPPGLMNPLRSYTLWYFASAADTAEGTSPSLTGIDGDQNVCFSISGNRAWIPPRGRGSFETLVLELPEAEIESNSWSFYALTYDVSQEVVSFAIGDRNVQLHKPGLSLGLWGCNSFMYLANTGNRARLSPIRFINRAAKRGSLQKLMLTVLPQYKVITGPELSLGEMVSRVERPRSSFDLRTVAISPPLALQQRVNHTDPNLPCKVCPLPNAC